MTRPTPTDQKLTAKAALEYLWYTQRCPTLAWIASVFQAQGGPHRAATLKALTRLHQAGYEIGVLSHMMPTERLLINGDGMTPAEVRAMADHL